MAPLRPLLVLALPFFAVIVLDQLTKAWVRQTIWESSKTITVVPGWLVFTPVANRGVAFGLFQEAGPFLGLAVVALFSFLAVRNWRKLVAAEPWVKLALSLIAGGAIGNLIDRAYLGYVIDFISVPKIWLFQVFNVSDAAISVGTVLLLVSAFRPRKEAPTAPAPSPNPEGQQTPI